MRTTMATATSSSSSSSDDVEQKETYTTSKDYCCCQKTTREHVVHAQTLFSLNRCYSRTELDAHCRCLVFDCRLLQLMVMVMVLIEITTRRRQPVRQTS